MQGRAEVSMADRTDLVRTGGAGGRQQRGLLTYSVLAGLTPLIPVPFVDDVVKNYFRRRLLRSVAAEAGRVLSEEELGALAAEAERGCLTGCLLTAVVYPLKAVFRKLFYFLEWKRAADVTSRTYHFGYLVGHALRPRADGASPLDLRGARAVGEAIEAVCREAPIKPIEAAVGGTFRKSKGVLRGAAALLTRSLRREPARPADVAAAVERVEPDEERELDPVVSRLQSSIASVPDGHFRALRDQLDARLGLAAKE
jgi:hypothetical protein